MGLLALIGCGQMRNTNPPRTATEQLLMSVAVEMAAERLALESLDGRPIHVDPVGMDLTEGPAKQEQLYMTGEIRAALLKAGARLRPARDEAEIIVEVRSDGIGIDRNEFLLGVPLDVVSAATGLHGAALIPTDSFDLAIVKDTRQYGFAGVAIVAYWRDTGELITAAGPAVGSTYKQDFLFFGRPREDAKEVPTVRELE